jgi:Domain of unknown function (DUF4189)
MTTTLLRKTVLATITALTLIPASLATPARADTPLAGALSYSPSTTRYGWATTRQGQADGVSQEVAEYRALKECQKGATINGSSDCRVLASVKNGAISLALGYNKVYGYAYAYGYGNADKAIAESNALNYCYQNGGGSCRILYTVVAH